MPQSLLARATSILSQLEGEEVTIPDAVHETVEEPKAATKEPDETKGQMELFQTVELDPKYEQVIEQIKKLNLMSMTPMDVMNVIYEWQKEIL
jgi:DNA mismatch repair protein MutS